MWQFFESFNDPRWRSERRFLCIFLPLILLVTSVSLTILLWERLFPVPEPPDNGVAAQTGLSGSPAPATPTPTATPPQANLGRGKAALDQGDVTSAKVFLAKAQEDKGSEAQACNELGTVELLAKNPDKAIVSFTEAIAIDDKNPQYFYNRSEALRLADRPGEALRDLQKARELDRRNPLYANKILLLRMESGDNAAVFREIKTNLELNLTSGQADWLGGAAAIEAEAGNIPHCVAYLQILRPTVSPDTFKLIVTDRFFDRHRKDGEFSRLLSPEPEP